VGLSLDAAAMSALGQKADISQRSRHVRFTPKANAFTLRKWETWRLAQLSAMYIESAQTSTTEGYDTCGAKLA
jgi:hypothetical protein